VAHVQRPERCRKLLDTCGTGGAPKTFNISTLAAIVAAAAAPGKLAVAKHGNRSRTGRGSAEFFDAMGLRLDASPETVASCLERVGVCFCFAVNHHPAMAHVAQARRELGFRTIFNLLGPMTNPARAEYQLLGVYDDHAAELMARALVSLGTKKTWVVHGLDGLDEITTTTNTKVREVTSAGVKEFLIDPCSLGLSLSTIDALAAKDSDHAARIAREVLDGVEGPHADIVALNAAAALTISEVSSDLQSGLELAFDALNSGRARETLMRLVEVSRS
jgi:anthranilate phosphoribosyltransferase